MGKKLLEYYENLIESIRPKCKWCGVTDLTNIPLESYSHEGGFEVEGFPEKQWLYITCPKCGHQWSLVKLGIFPN